MGGSRIISRRRRRARTHQPPALERDTVNTPEIIHSEACIRALARQEAYDLKWPDRCNKCFGAGGAWSSFDPSPRGSRAPSLGPGTMTDFDTCECVNESRCPRCARHLEGPKYGLLRLRLQAVHGIERLLIRSHQAQVTVLLGRALYWRASAAFREDPNAWTWAGYHVADQLWNRIYQRSHRQTWPSKLLRPLQEVLEGDYVSSTTPCWYCGWAWGEKPGDARDPHTCECWVANWEAEQDEAQEWAERERDQRDFIGGATHLLMGLPGGPIPVRRIFGGLYRDSESEGGGG